MTEPLHHIIVIPFGIIKEGGNRLLVKASKYRLKPVKAGGLDFANKSRLFANPESDFTEFHLFFIIYKHILFTVYHACTKPQ